MHQRGRGVRARGQLGAGAAAAGALAAAVAAAVGAAEGAPPVPVESAPRKGTPCETVTLPGGAKIDAKPGCTVSDARYSAQVAAVVWWMPVADDDDARSGGLVIADRSAPGAPAAVRLFEETTIPRIVDVRDVSGDGMDDVILTTLNEADKPEDEAAEYFIYGRRRDGFGDLGTYFVLAPKWGTGEFTGIFRTLSADDDSTWKFDSFRFVRVAEDEKKVDGLKATATSAMAKYPASNAVDGDYKTTWTEARKDGGAGVKITVTLPKKIVLGRLSFATGYDAISPKWGDLYWLNNHVSDVTLKFDGGIEKRIPVGYGARWIDYVPHEDFSTKKIVLTIDTVHRGLKWNDTCINEIQVFERTP